MVILKTIGFDIYADLAEFKEEEGIGGIGFSLNTTGGRFGGGALEFNNDDIGMNITMPSNPTLLFFSGSIKHNVPYSVGDEIIHFRSSSGTHARFNSVALSSTIQVFTAGISRGTFTIDMGVWHRIEIKVKVDDTTGNVTVRLDGIEVFTFEGDVKTGGDTFVDTIELDGTSTVAGLTSWDDIIINDDQGGVNDDFLGDLRIETLRPDGESPQIDFTPSSGGDNSLMVDEAPGADDDTTFVSSATPADQDLYSSTDTTGLEPVIIYGIVVKGKVKKDDASPRSVIFLANTGTIGSSASQTLSTDYVFQSGIFDTDPSTDGAPFTQANVDAIEMGIEVA